MRDVLKQFFDLPVPDEGPWADYSSLDYEVNDGLIEQLHEAIENPAVLEGVDGDDVDPIRTHAWRMLVRVGGLSQFDFLLRRLEACEVYDDFAYIDDFSALCQELGEGAIPLLLEKLHDRQPLTLMEGSLVEALREFAEKGQQREVIISGLTDELNRCLQTHLSNAHIVAVLVALKATGSMDVIRKAYATDLVNQALCGSLFDAEEELGLLDPSAEKPEFDIYAETEKYAYLERLLFFEKPAADAGAHTKANYLLRLYGNDSTCEGGSGLEGVLAASLAMEALVPLDELLSVIWSASPDGEQPVWQDAKHEGEFLDLVIEIQKDVSSRMSKQSYVPTGDLRDPDAGPPQTEEEELQAISFTTWAFGLIRGFSQFLSEEKQKTSPWMEFIERASHLLIFELKEELVSKAEDHPIMEVLTDLIDLRAAAQSGGLDALASVVRATPEPVRVEDTPGRNEPCPCGSGKKYKKCCAV